jgi:hypothetical protein
MKKILLILCKIALLLTVLILIPSISLFAEDPDTLFNMDIPILYGEENFIGRIDTQTGGTRNSVGLVLSGGSARAFAHIGILRYLEEVGVVPYAASVNRIDVPVSYEITGTWNTGTYRSLLTTGVRYSLLSTTEQESNWYIETGYQLIDFSRNELYGIGGIEIPIADEL